VNSGRIGEVSPAEFFRLLFQMTLDQGDLLFIRWLFDHNPLQAAILCQSTV